MGNVNTDKYWAVLSKRCMHWDGIYNSQEEAIGELQFYEFYVPNGEWGLVELTNEQADSFVKEYPHMDKIHKVVRMLPVPKNKLVYYRGLIFNNNFKEE